MLLEIVSYNGHTLNDTTISAWFPAGQPVMPGADKKYSPRARNFQKLASKDMKEPSFYFHVELKGTIHTQLETLKAWFPLLDYTPRAFVVKDTADSNRQWYVMGYAVTPPIPVEDGAGEYVIELAIDEPLWRTVTTHEDTWAITASGQTKSLTVLGNYPARPKFTIGMSQPKTTGYSYKLWLPWYNPLTVENAEPLEVTGGGINTAAIINDTTVSNQLNGAIDADDLTFSIDTPVGGGLKTSGGMLYVGTEQIYYTGITAGVVTVYNSGGVTGRGWGGTTAASHADNAVCARSKMLANGNDMRVFINNAEVDRWLTGINTSATKVWITQRYRAAITMTSDTAIASSGSVTSISVEKKPNGKENLAALKLLPPVFMFYIGSEVFYGYNPQPTDYKFSVSARAQKDTSMAAHAKKDVIRIIEHDMYLMWGNALDDAPSVDSRKEPAIDMTNSTNTSWVHTVFGADSGLRPASWKNAVVKQTGDQSYSYTATEGGDADPITDIGFAVKVYQANGKTKAETFDHTWSLYHPAGFTSVTAAGKKRRLSTDWIKFTFERFTTKWAEVFTEATPSAASSWEALSTHSGVAISGSPQTVRFEGNGTLKATTGNENDFEVSGTTLGLVTANVMQKAVLGSAAKDNIYLDGKITVVETGDAIFLRGLTSQDVEIVVDCDAETLTVNGGENTIDIQWNTARGNWLDLPSTAQYATCTLKYEETGIDALAIDIEWEDRNTL